MAKPKSDTGTDVDVELKVLSTCSKQLAQLSPEAAARVLLYLARKCDVVVVSAPLQSGSRRSNGHCDEAAAPTETPLHAER